MSPIKPGGVYRHYKGPLYKVFFVAKHSETLEDLVVYECLYENSAGQFWTRPLAMFTGTIEIDGKTVPRFALMEESP